MDPAALALALSSALVHAAWNMLAKRSGDQFAFIYLQFTVGWVVASPLLFLLFRDGIPPAVLKLMLFSTVAHATYTYSLAASYRYGDLSMVYPFSRGLGLAIVPIAAYFLLGESVSPLGALGIGLIASGILYIGIAAAWKGSSGIPPLTNQRLEGAATRVPRRRYAWMVLCGMAIAGYSLLDKTAVQQVSPLGYLPAVLLGCCIWLTPAALAQRARLATAWRTGWRSIVAAGVASNLGYLLVLFAFRLTKVSYVVAARESSILFAVLLGGLLLREKQMRRRLAGAVAIVAGLACLTLAK